MYILAVTISEKECEEYVVTPNKVHSYIAIPSSFYKIFLSIYELFTDWEENVKSECTNIIKSLSINAHKHNTFDTYHAIM